MIDETLLIQQDTKYNKRKKQGKKANREGSVKQTAVIIIKTASPMSTSPTFLTSLDDSEDFSYTPPTLPPLSDDRREDWIRLQAERASSHKVIPNTGLISSSSLYFGTRRCTLSDVLCVVTTIDLLAPSKLDRDLRELDARTTPNAIGSGASAVSSIADPRFASPLYPTYDLASDERLRRNKALWKEQVIFMTALKEQREKRIGAEFRGASALQRMWRGFQLRRWLKKSAKKMKTRKRMKRSYAKIALKIRMQKEMEDNLRKAETRREDAADTIAATFRMFVAYACSMKERTLRQDEVRKWGAILIQGMVRQRSARRRLTRRRQRVLEYILRHNSIRIQTMWRTYAAVRKVNAIRIRLQRVASIWIQRWYRRHVAIKVAASYRARLRTNALNIAANVVQRHWRGIQGRRKAYMKQHSEEAELLEAAALAVQCAFRGLSARQVVHKRRYRRLFQNRLRASIKIQKMARYRAGNELLQDEMDRQEADIWVQIRKGNVVAVEDLFKGFGTTDTYTSESTDEDGNTILGAAAKWGHKRLVRRALKWACDINHFNDDGLTAVEVAVQNDHENVAEYLIDHEADVTKFGRTLLHEAGARDMPSVASALLTRNVPAHSLDPDGVTPLHEACGAASDKVAKLLIDRGAALDNQITSTGRTPLHEAALGGDKTPSVRIVTLLMEAGARIDIKDIQGKTPWRAALTKNHQAVAKILRTSMRGKFAAEEVALTAKTQGLTNEQQIEIFNWARNGDTNKIEDKLDHGVPVNMQLGDTGESLLMAAASSGNLQLVEMLFRKGAKADLEDLRGRNALHYGAKFVKIGTTVVMRGANLLHADAETGSTALHVCATEGHVFDEIMRDLKVTPDVVDGLGRTPLHCAAENGRTVACQKLLKLGANASARVYSDRPKSSDYASKTPLHLAARTIHGMDAMRALVDFGAPLDIKDANGRLPLHDAAESGAAGNILILCEAVGGTKGVNVLDETGESPVHIACKAGKLGAVRALLAKGGDPTIPTKNGLDAIALAMESGRSGDSIVSFLAKKKKLLTDVGNTTYGKKKWTAFHVAAK